MVTIGLHAAHELYAPSELLEHLRFGEEAGFSTAMCSDHFYPWTPSQGQSGHSFTWLAAALARTRMSMGTICYPCGRYHPAVLAQTTATLSEMFPDRFWLALGTGEAVNESITGQAWPAKPERRAMVEQSAQALRALWAGEQVDCDGLITIRNARLYTRSARPPKLYGAATTPETAAWVGRWADGLLTTGSEHEAIRQTIDSFRQVGGGDKPVVMQSAVAFDPVEDRAWKAVCRTWPIASLGQNDLQNFTSPEQFAQATRDVCPSDLHGKLRVASDPARHAAWIEEDASLGIDAIYLHNIGDDQERFIRFYAEQVIPQLSLDLIPS